MERVTFLSPSALERYRLCPRLYRFLYVDGLWRLSRSSAQQAFGTSVHAALREFFRVPVGRRSLRRGDEQPRLADAGLTLERERRQPSGPGRRELLPDRAELNLPPDHGPRCPPDVEGQWGHLGRGRSGSGLRVFHGRRKVR